MKSSFLWLWRKVIGVEEGEKNRAERERERERETAAKAIRLFGIWQFYSCKRTATISHMYAFIFKFTPSRQAFQLFKIVKKLGINILGGNFTA